MTHSNNQFDELATLYNNLSEWPFRRDIEMPSVRERLGDVSGLRILDFGCGAGTYSRLLKQAGAAEVVGYDVADGMLRYASRREESEQLGIRYTARLDQLPEQHFDLVLSVYVLPYARTHAELAQMCRNMRAPLKKGGRLLTLPLHPEYAIEPDYYQPYGFTLTTSAPYKDGSIVGLSLHHGGYEAEVEARYWSAGALQAALEKEGFTSVTSHDPRPAAYRDTESAPEALRAYLRRPHAVLLDCKLGAAPDTRP